ncbi:TRAP transporter small permease subunit [Castellaniella sp. S9]|uniref:TRAP transporter small permease subunit n=1 Tax=Castellaniella sp. S9 TaxID=2993652 RepID=UPI0022B3BC47|nr:TRAP transporter small permease subunit [Castellaniella sp. S9]
MAKLAPFADSIIRHLVKLCFYVSAALIVLLVLIGAGDAAGSAVFNQGIPAATELSAAILAATVATALPYAQSRNEHIIVDIVIALIKGKVRRYVDIVAYIVSTAVFALVAWAGFNSAVASTANLEFASAVYSFPIYPFKIAFAFGVLVMLLETIRQSVHALSGKSSLPI